MAGMPEIKSQTFLPVQGIEPLSLVGFEFSSQIATQNLRLLLISKSVSRVAVFATKKQQQQMFDLPCIVLQNATQIWKLLLRSRNV